MLRLESRERWGISATRDSRLPLLTSARFQPRIRMQFPQGMGLPFSSDEKLSFMAMGFNQDATAKIPPQVFNLTLHYIPENEAHGEIRPLFHRMARVWLPIKGAHGENCDMFPDEKK